MAIGNVKIAKMSTFHDGELCSLTPQTFSPMWRGPRKLLLWDFGYNFILLPHIFVLFGSMWNFNNVWPECCEVNCGLLVEQHKLLPVP